MLVCFYLVLDQQLLQNCRMKMFSVAHKTVFVVDHCPYMAESSRQQVECDVLTKTRAQGVIPLAPVSKSLWTCAVECSMEYCRILYDIYPVDKLVSFLLVCFSFILKYFSLRCLTFSATSFILQINYIVSDSEFHMLNSWRREEQSTHEVIHYIFKLNKSSYNN